GDGHGGRPVDVVVAGLALQRVHKGRVQHVRRVGVGVDQRAVGGPQLSGAEVGEHALFEAESHGYLYAGRAGAQEVGEQRVVVGELGDDGPLVLLPPEVGVEDVGHVVPLEA